MMKLLLLAVLNAMLFVNAEMTCHYEALTDPADCPDDDGTFTDEIYHEIFWVSYDYDGTSTPECPLDPNEALTLFNEGSLICEADAKYFMDAHYDEFANLEFQATGDTDEWDRVPSGSLNQTDWDTRPEGTNADENNCNGELDMYHIRCEEVTDVGGEGCKPLDEAACAAQPDSCRATTRGGKFRKCKPKRCKPMTESECEAAVHCEKKLGRTGNYKKCRRIDSSRA